MTAKSYLMITRNSMMAGLAYRAHFFFTVLGTVVYLVVSYFLWKAIYAGAEVINGLTFSQAYLYVGISISLFGLMQAWTEWYMSSLIVNGDLIRFLCKPMDFPLQLLFDQTGQVVMNLAGIALPAMIVCYALCGAPVPSVLHVLLFTGAVCLGMLLNFCIDFITGLSAFATQSIWGISTAKEVTVMFLSGAAVPLAFFPDAFRRVLEWLPFQAIYNTPVRLLIDPTLTGPEMLLFFLKQAGWLILLWLLARLLFKIALRKLTVNGG